MRCCFRYQTASEWSHPWDFDPVSRLDEAARRFARTKSWIIRQALAEWLGEEQRRYELTLEASNSVDEGRTFTHDDMTEHFAQRKRDRTRSST